MDFQDKVAVVTGASEGLGRMFSKDLVDRGARVFGLARSTDKLNAVRDDLGEAFHPVTCDVREEDAVNEAFDQILKASDDRIDILINNAGLGRFGDVVDLSTDEWDVQMETNLRGVFLCTRATIPVMKQQNEATGFGGHIVNIASIAGLIGNPSIAAYNTSKFGLRGFSAALMKEVRDDGIKVTCVYPGSIDTNFGSNAGSSGSPNPMTPESVSATVMHVMEGPDNYLISEVVMRPLRPRG